MTDWWDLAYCKGAPGDAFFPSEHTPNGYLEARSYCVRCPVQTECMMYAIDNNIEHGMWGGLTPNMRSRMRLELQTMTDANAGHGDKPGTTAGFYRERAAGLTPCAACRDAYNASAIRNRARRKEARNARVRSA
jgi:WhiB family transcriptional regulator, redox-sensing transcriptional regulator